ncbi:AI-2E family transporter [Amaricoccus solimangrovi]|uniref:AI-2E family transporter n=1 Tax=Amaricoccus solimangrovi TaxID=2589815 RepID=A0A501WV36_9RHOB|nr:AI-2E family transporter [Amaricoccus solimangrovi]TPE52175.1 AI-2E family transporter [Amaricoccus solimangrovi]
MALTAAQQWRIWGLVIAGVLLLLWLLAGTLLPFFGGAALAYLLDPVADRLERLGLGRITATTIIAAALTLLIALGLLLAVPLLVEQAQSLIGAIPDYLASASHFLGGRFPQLFDESSAIGRGLASAETALRDSGGVVLGSVLASSLQVLNFFYVLVVTPVVAFYLLIDWDHFVARVNAALPRAHAPTIRRLCREIDAVMAGFVRGQLLVCVVLGAFYAISLMLIGVPYGLLVGIVSGMIVFIPFVGSTVGLLVGTGIAAVTFWEEPFWIFATAGVFMIGQFFEGNILSPMLVGKSVGLHPVTLMLALSVFGVLFGFTGLLIAVPLAAALGVLGRYAFEKYLESPLYSGATPPEDEEGEEVLDPAAPPIGEE